MCVGSTDYTYFGTYFGACYAVGALMIQEIAPIA